MFKQLLKYYHTIKYLKWLQIKHQLWYRIRSFLPILSNISHADELQANAIQHQTISLEESIMNRGLWLDGRRFRFLNIEHDFKGAIDWNYSSHGKLWIYNLNYFEYLSQGQLSKENGLELIHSFIEEEANIKDGLEPFPTSLRLIFWIKFIIQNNIKEEKIEQSIYRQAYRLSAMPEYHLMGNHLLENGFSLLFCAVYFADNKLYNQANQIIVEQLQEQVLADGGHFELSPMYHQILLYRILDCINLLQHATTISSEDLQKVLQENASMMLGWMKKMTFSNGDMPRLNDSTIGIAPNSKVLQKYAKRLNIIPSVISLKESGYRKIVKEAYEVILDIGQIGPDYIPGHAHSDTFNFVLYYDEKPLIVDTGISTYEKNERRQLERSTISHNTVGIRNEEQSEIWGGFRVARRANVTILEDDTNKFIAKHDGYKKIGCIHQRSFLGEKSSFILEDIITGDQEGIASFHFYPGTRMELLDNIIQGEAWQICFENYNKISIENYYYAKGYNETTKAIQILVSFRHKLTTTITFT